MKKRAILLICALCANIARSSPEAAASAVTDVRSDADWIMSARLADGAIANYVDRQAVWPYLSNFAAMGLARATEVTKDTKYVKASWTWLAWYRAHMDTRGFVTDYVVRNGQLVSTGFMDSTDAYAATFLMALRDTYRADPSLTRLRANRAAVTAAIKAIEATQDADGLTWAKPDWHVKYLMDQAEVYAGLLAGAEIAKTLNDLALRKRALADSVRVRDGVARLWDGTANAYDWAVHGDGARTGASWSVLYPDALQQAWAVAFGLVPATRGALIMSRFVTEQPAWDEPLALATFAGGMSQPVGYWPVAGLALRRVGSVLAVAGGTSIRTIASNTGRAWPFTTATAGQLILLSAIGLPGARTLDAQPLTTLVTTTVGTIPTLSKTSSPAPASATPGTTPAPTGTTPSPTPAPLLRVERDVGPVGAEVVIQPDGIGVGATASPLTQPGP